ncbi:signal peptide peptidase SppA [candidate division WOR-3 bacterium]|uniref:Signal peptide peptidase SppA n=1 Tax=candidate division WOR-3 bacterium TaxID=2052148 RepID=A0A9D5KAP9_UNCW3|nr:signal peptide peptidase SppA [candidate division WOR-3 bacterium]MBD3365342.1 signal peptide peptidase SppA [candidate division WOR-3 bacterium]
MMKRAAGFFLLSIFLFLFTGCKDRLGLVEIEGVIYDSSDLDKVLEDIETFTEDPSIKGVLVEVNSPGGGVAASQEICEAIKRLKAEDKKVVVSMGSLAASGGYYIAAPADVIVALPGTLTGSIGVILNFIVYKDLMDKVGLKAYVIKSREHKDIGSGFREPTTSDTTLLKGMIEDVYQQFLEEVVADRELPYDSVYAVADGRILTGRQAYEYGLVDTLGTKDDAHKILAELCGFEGKPKLVEIPKKLSFWEEIMETKLQPLLMPSLRYQLDLR